MSDRSTRITRLLVANRGEIAVRIIRAARELGIASVAIYSDADAGAPHVRAADDAVHVGPTPARDSYLNIERVISAARDSGADAVHPGYGFLSENPAFAQAVADAGLIFVGPSASAMRAVGDKARAKQVAAQADVPTVPSWALEQVPDAELPVLVKASAGGGGRGMRIVRSAQELAGALESARREAAAGFGDDTLIVEKLVEGARHVEVQLLADEHGTALYLGDRDCSLQRRHQKVIEEAPAPGLPGSLHMLLGEAAVRIAKAAGYSNAGTAEFLVDAHGRFYFLELNARLQVEHPVTELAFGVDLVRWQLRIAQGEPLDLTQEQLGSHAHAIEARVYAEDPVTFLPTGGRLLDVGLPAPSPALRVDHAMQAGRDVSIAYDPLLAKVIASGATREDARQELLAALAQMSLPGVVTNIALLQHALTLPAFVDGTHSIETLEQNPLDASALMPPEQVVRAARRQQFVPRWAQDPFSSLRGWRDGASRGGDAAPDEPEVQLTSSGDRIWATWQGRSWELPRETIERGASAAAADGSSGDHVELVAPMPGTVIKVAEPGTAVRAGEAVVVLEAMKMENALAAPFDGVIDQVACSIGELVPRGATLASVVRESGSASHQQPQKVHS